MIDIGTLTGTLELEDQLSPLITKIEGNLHHFADAVTDTFGTAGIVVGGFVAVVVGLGAAIIGLGEKGSTLNDVEASFNRLAESAGTTGDVLRENLSEGVRGTVGDMTLMQTTTRLLSSGMKLTGEEAKLMGEASRALGKATGTDAAGGLSILSGALTTGRVRALQAQGVIVDLKGAEGAFAKTLGVTASELSREGKLHADRNAILQATQTWVDRVGVSELSFKERILQTRVALEEWGASLAKSVAASPNVLAAYDAIKDAIVRAFGGDSQSLLNTIVGWVNNFADAVATYGPPIIQTIADIWHGIQDVWAIVKQAWDDVPEWFKNIARDAGIAGISVYAVSQALGAIGGTDVLGTLANIAQIWGTWASVLPKAYVGIVNLTAAWYLEATAAGTAAAATGLVTLSLAAVLIPLATAYKLVQVLTIGWDLWTQKTQSAKDAAWQLAADQRNLALASEIAGTKVTDIGKAMQILRDRAADLRGETSPMIRQQHEMGVVIGVTLDQVNAEGDSFVDTASKAAEFAKKSKALLDTLRGSGEEVKIFADAFRHLTIAELASFEVQQRLIPQIEKLAAAGVTLTASMQAEYEAAIRSQVAHQAAADAVLSAKNYTLEYVKSQEALGVSQATLAIRAGVTVDQLKTYVSQLERTQRITDEIVKSQDALWSARNASQMKGLTLQEVEEQRAAQGSYELGITTAEALGKARSSIIEKYAAQQLTLADAANEKLKDNELTALDKRIKLEGISQANGEKLKSAIVETYALKRTGILGDEADRAAKIAAAGNTQIYDAQKQLTDEMKRLTMTSTQYQISKINEQRDAQLAAFKGLPEQYQAYADKVNHIADLQVNALKRDNDALKNNSKAALQEVADKAAATYAYATAHAEMYSKAAIKAFKEAAEAAKEAADPTRWQKLATELDKVEGALSSGASAWRHLADVSSGGMQTFAKAMAAVQESAALIVGDVKGLLQAKDAIGAIIAATKLAIDTIGLLWDKFTVSPGEDVARRVAKNFGTKITEALGDSIAASAKKLFGGSRAAAEIFHLSDILDAAGGLTTKNFDTFTARLHDVFSMLQTGAFDSGQAVKVLEDNFAKFAEYATKDNTLVTQSFKDLIIEADRAGLSVKAINDFQIKQTSGAVTGIEALLAPGSQALDAYAAKQKELEKLQDQAFVLQAKGSHMTDKAISDLDKKLSTLRGKTSGLTGKSLEANKQQIHDLEGQIADLKTNPVLDSSAFANNQDSLGKLIDQIGKLKLEMAAMPKFAIASQQAAEGIAAALLGSFDELTKRGLSAADAIRQMAPAIESLGAQLEGTGLTGGAAFDSIKSMATIATDTITGPLVDAVHGGASALTGLHNAGLLDQKMFFGLTDQIVSTFDSLVKQSGDGASALRLIGPDIQRIWELQQDFGFSVDSATQALIDQGKTAGLVGDQHRTAQDRMARGIEKIATLMETFVESLGIDVPNAADAASRAIGGLVNSIPTNPFESWQIPDATGYVADYKGLRPDDAGSGQNGPVDWNNPNLKDWLTRNPGDEGRAAEMWKRGGWAEFMSGGGIVPQPKVSYYSTGTPTPRGTDTVPAMLTPGEVVVPKARVDDVFSGKGDMTFILQPGAISIKGENRNAEELARDLIPAMLTEFRRNYDGSRSEMESMFGKGD